MNTTPPIILRYFACRGRAQPLRDFLYDADIKFQDEQFEFETFPHPWLEARSNRDFSGPFASLPVFQQGDFQISETLAIASYLEHTIGQKNIHRDECKLATLNMISSACYLEIIVSIGELIWSEGLSPQLRLEDAISEKLPKILDKLRSVDRLVPNDDKYFGGNIPSVADFFVFEAFDAIRYFLGPNNAPLTQRLRELDGLSRRLLSRPRFAAMFTAGFRPASMTSYPEENAVIEKARAIEWTTVL